MSTGLLYHAFGIRGYQHKRNDFVEGRGGFHNHTTAGESTLPGLRVGRGSQTQRKLAVVSLVADRVEADGGGLRKRSA